MNKNSFPLLAMLLTAFFSSIFGQQVAVAYDTLAIHTNRGVLYPVSLFETIRDKDTLNEYFRKIGYDTLQVSKKPDFDSEMVIAVVTAFFGGDLGNIGYYHKIEKITDEADSIVVGIHLDSIVYNTEVQQNYSIIMLTIPRSDKPVFFRVGSPSSARKSVGHAFIGFNSGLLPRRTNRLFDIKGRALRCECLFGNCIVVQSTPHGNKKDVFLGGKVYRMK